MTMGEYIKQLRTQRGMSQEELGKLCGVNRAAVNKWEVGTTENMKRSVIKTLSEIFNVSPTQLLCLTEPKPAPDQSRVPLLGAISCGPGTSMTILEDIEKPSFVKADIAFQVHGNSMESKGIFDNDLVYVRRCPVKDNQIACVRIGNEYLMKVVSFGPDFVALLSDIPPIYIRGEQEDYEPIGEPVAVLHTL